MLQLRINVVDNTQESIEEIGDVSPNQITVEAVNELIKESNLENDEQTKYMVNVLLASANYSDKKYKLLIADMFKIVQNVDKLLLEMKKESKEVKEIAEGTEGLIKMFIFVFASIKTKLKRLLPCLEISRHEIAEIIKILNIEDNIQFSEVDKDALRLLLDGLYVTRDSLKKEIAKEAVANRKILEDSQQIKANIEKYKEKSINRMDLFKKLFPALGGTTGGALLGSTSTAIAMSEVLGGAGLIVVGGLTLTVPIIVFSVISGFGIFASISSFIYYLLKQNKEGLFSKLNDILRELQTLDEMSSKLLNSSNKIDEKSEEILRQIELIKTNGRLENIRLKEGNKLIVTKIYEILNSDINAINDILIMNTECWTQDDNIANGIDTAIKSLTLEENRS